MRTMCILVTAVPCTITARGSRPRIEPARSIQALRHGIAFGNSQLYLEQTRDRRRVLEHSHHECPADAAASHVRRDRHAIERRAVPLLWALRNRESGDADQLPGVVERTEDRVAGPSRRDQSLDHR